MKYLLLSCSLLASGTLFAQFEPAAGSKGSTAIWKDSSIITAWATGIINVSSGYLDISRPDLGRNISTNIGGALGKAGTKGTYSLGDGGIALLVFPSPITNQSGPDFAVFENGFREAGTNLDFLEFAFVEVSSDGEHFVRFPSLYEGDTTVQIGEFQTVDTRKYHNLAGKYTAGFGTPFDLEELKDAPDLNINSITQVRIVDVIGTMDPQFASRDSKGVKINEPWPSAYNSGGFDLDAVGVMHAGDLTGLLSDNWSSVSQPYPNPAKEQVTIPALNENEAISLTDLAGNNMATLEANAQGIVRLPSVATGLYFIRVSHASGQRLYKLAIR